MSDTQQCTFVPTNSSVKFDVQNTDTGSFAYIDKINKEGDQNNVQNQPIQKTKIKKPLSNSNDLEWAENLRIILERISTDMKNDNSDETINETEDAKDECEEQQPIVLNEIPKNIKGNLKSSDKDCEKIIKSKKKLDFDKAVRKTAESIPYISKNIINKLRIIQTCSATHQLLTQSHYQGVWCDALQCMDGYGTYTYPDGSKYRGYFSNGQFNGHGTLHLAVPYNFNYKGTFIDGLIHEIEDMWFDDGLRVDATFDGWSADFSKWKYCSARDRRFSKEQEERLPAVGPYSFLTNDKKPRELGEAYYDLLDGGFFNPSSGMIINRPKPFPNIYVPCQQEVKWIKESCRHGKDIPSKTTAEVCAKIIKNNLENEMDLQEYDPSCNYDQKLDLQNYYSKMCQGGAQANASQETFDCRLQDSSPSISSLTDDTMYIEVQEHLETNRRYDKIQLGRDLEAEESTLVLVEQP